MKKVIAILLLINTGVEAKSSTPTVQYTGKNNVPVPSKVYIPPSPPPVQKKYEWKYVTPCGMIKECKR